MQVVLVFKLLLASFLLLLTTISYTSIIFIPNALADSPSFSRQEAGDNKRDGININGVAGVQGSDDYKDPLDNSTDIWKITYLSDGKNLNATVWLGGNFSENPASNGAKAAVYGMLLDIDSNPKTGFQGVDYQLEVQWMNSSKMWNMFLGEYPSVDNPVSKNPADYLKILDIKQNYTGFFADDNKPYVTLSLPLKDVAFPTKFKAMYYAIVIYDYSNMIVDLGSWIDIPPPDVAVSTLPNPVVIRQGEQEDIAVQLKSNGAFISNVVNFLPMENYSKIDIEPKNLDQVDSASPLSNSGLTIFKIKASSDAEIGEYTIPILANISTGAVFPSQFVRLSNFSFSIPTKGNIVRVGNFTILVTEPLTAQEEVKEFWNAYGGIVSLIGAGFGGAFASYVLDRVKNRKNASNNRS
jgi:hypothetical protein